jgi:hypothetical protein
MKKVAIQARHRNQYLRHGLQLDLFWWKPTPPRHDNRAATIIAKRFGLSVEHAATVAQLAGFGGSHYEWR